MRVRNRDRWTVVGVDPDGSLTVSHLNGHGTTTLPADYARHHVRLGYAATAHGHQGDTVDVGLAVVTQATSHRGLYVGATRGRQENRLLVVTDDTDPEAARDVLERVLTNDRADVPAVVQRRNLARQVPRARPAEDAVTVARRNFGVVRRSARAYLLPLATARSEARAAEAALREQRADLANAPRWRRRGMTAQLRAASDVLDATRSKVDELELLAAPRTARVDAGEQRLRQAERDASMARIKERLDGLSLEPPSQTKERSVGIEAPGLEL